MNNAVRSIYQARNCQTNTGKCKTTDEILYAVPCIVWVDCVQEKSIHTGRCYNRGLAARTKRKTCFTEGN